MLIDTHLHLNSYRYVDEKMTPDQILKKAIDQGVGKFISISTQTSDFSELTALSETFPNVYHTLGIYPTYNLGFKISDFEILVENEINEKTVGIGECGFNQPIEENERNIKSQEALFEMQIELAIRKNLPLIVHNRNSDAEVLNVLKRYSQNNLRGVIHCFVSDYSFAKKVLDLGFYLSFNGIITYKSGQNIHETIAKMPLNRILLETDAPYLTPEPHRKEINEPKHLPIIFKKISEIRKIEETVLENQILENSYQLFDKIKRNND